jgi:hypothetical protein
MVLQWLGPQQLPGRHSLGQQSSQGEHAGPPPQVQTPPPASSPLQQIPFEQNWLPTQSACDVHATGWPESASSGASGATSASDAASPRASTPPSDAGTSPSIMSAGSWSTTTLPQATNQQPIHKSAAGRRSIMAHPRP